MSTVASPATAPTTIGWTRRSPEGGVPVGVGSVISADTAVSRRTLSPERSERSRRSPRVSRSGDHGIVIQRYRSSVGGRCALDSMP